MCLHVCEEPLRCRCFTLCRKLLILLVFHLQPQSGSSDFTAVCSHPPTVEHGNYVCHPQPCDGFAHDTVVEFYCDPGYTFVNDYRYITCQYGQWLPHIQVYCVQTESSWPNSEETSTTWKLVSFTATSVLLALLLLILIKVFQLRCKTYCQLRDHNPHHSSQNFLVVDGIPVLLPSYDEAVGSDNSIPTFGAESLLHPEDQGPPAYPGEPHNPLEGTNMVLAVSADRSSTVDIADDIPLVEDGAEDC